jgi:hypothetical protein
MNHSPAPVLPERVPSVAAVDKLGHESLFPYPEVRCDSNGLCHSRERFQRDLTSASADRGG